MKSVSPQSTMHAWAYLCGFSAHLTNLCVSFKCHLWSRPHNLPIYPRLFLPLQFLLLFLYNIVLLQRFCCILFNNINKICPLHGMFQFCLTYLWHVASRYSRNIQTSTIYVFISQYSIEIAVGLLHNQSIDSDTNEFKSRKLKLELDLRLAHGVLFRSNPFHPYGLWVILRLDSAKCRLFFYLLNIYNNSRCAESLI